MSRKEQWRKRVRGTPRQIGQVFRLAEREAKTKLSKELQTVVPKEALEEKEELTQEDIDGLASELEYALLTDDWRKILELYATLEELNKAVEQIDSPQGVKREKYQRALDEIAQELKRAKSERVPSDLVPVGRTKSGKMVYEKRKSE